MGTALPSTTRMKISVEKETYKLIDAPKIIHGRFLTRHAVWLTAPVKAFIQAALSEGASTVLDPFAGEGDILKACQETFACQTLGFDIERPALWPLNDSLLAIANPNDALICTNPPYLAKHSAARKGVTCHLKEPYFQQTHWADLYQIALERCLAAARHVVAIVPETFLLSDFPKHHLVLASVLQENPFTDTTIPTCVACFNRDYVLGETAAKLYLGNTFCLNYGDLRAHEPQPKGRLKVVFNQPDGKIALRAVDGTAPSQQAGFLLANDFGYLRAKIKNSSRLMTYLDVPALAASQTPDLIRRANLHLAHLRAQTCDLIFSPFKGNNKAGQRRRRIDYRTARWALEQAAQELGIGYE